MTVRYLKTQEHGMIMESSQGDSPFLARAVSQRGGRGCGLD